VAAARRPLTSRISSDGPPLSYRAFVPSTGCHRRPLILVHGTGRGSNRQFRAFLPSAIASGVPLIAPAFPEGSFAGYQSLAGARGPLAAMTAFEATLADASTHLNIPTDRVDLFGYSGGAQFVHRFAMLSPARVQRAVVVAAGWYTYLGDGRPFPHGAGPSEHSGGRAVDVEAFLRIPMHVLVGERDVERDDSLRTGESIDRRQGRDRLTRALRWMDHLEEAAHRRGLRPVVSFDLLTDTGHSFSEAVNRGSLLERTFTFLYPIHATADISTADPTPGPPT
jgi:pimeloyl-ACP methyl ester carboxylesterase